MAHSIRERLEEEIRHLKARIEQLTAERDDLVYRECRELQAEYNRKIGGLEQEAMEAEVQVRALKRMIELMQAQINRAEDPDEEEAKNATDDELKRFFEELRKRAERIKREEEHARKRAEKERKNREKYQKEKATEKDNVPKDEGEEIEEKSNGENKDKAQETLEQELKRLYRKIVKKLHPDMNPDITEEEKEMFRKAVEAYGLGDAEVLREIAAHIDDEEWLENGGKEELPVERLMEMRDRLREQMERLLDEIRRIKMAFPYSAKSFLRDSVKVRKKQDELKKYIESCKEMMDKLRERIAKMQDDSEKARKQKKGKA